MASALAAVAKGLVKSLFSPYLPFRISDRRYFGLQAHPDDEILIAGLYGRIISRSSTPAFACLTDGSRNTDQNRQAELNGSFGEIKYGKEVPILMGESELVTLASSGRTAEAGELLLEAVDKVEGMIETRKADTILTLDYSGGHFVHDLTQLVAVTAARRVAKDRKIEVYEYPQFYFDLKPGVYADREAITQLIGEWAKPVRNWNKISSIAMGLTGVSGIEDFSSIADYKLGHFAPGEFVGLHDEDLGVKQGIVKLNPAEMITKIRMKGHHKSQNGSLNRTRDMITEFPDFSTEMVRQVPLDRDYSQAPCKVPLYEVIPWRPRVRFETFGKIAEYMQSKESTS